MTVKNELLFEEDKLKVFSSRFAGSNPAEVDGFFQDVKILSTSPPGGTLS